MELTNTFEIPVPVDEAWRILQDIERIAPCMPGATLEAAEGDEFRGKVKVKVGPIQVTYRGTARFVERDDAAHRAVIDASGKEARGSGTARATVTTELSARGDRTAAVVTTDLAITGKPAQFGRGVMAEVAAKLLDQFADCLAAELAAEPEAAGEDEARADDGAAASPAGVTEPGVTDATAAGGPQGAEPARSSREPAAPRRSDEAIDLLDLAGASIGKRLAPVVAVVLAVLLVVWLARRRR
jgi:uncharacterized protein